MCASPDIKYISYNRSHPSADGTLCGEVVKRRLHYVCSAVNLAQVLSPLPRPAALFFLIFVFGRILTLITLSLEALLIQSLSLTHHPLTATLYIFRVLVRILH